MLIIKKIDCNEGWQGGNIVVTQDKKKKAEKAENAENADLKMCL